MECLNLMELTIEIAVLIFIIGIVRQLFQKNMSPNFRYLLWILVVLRILIPVRMEFIVELPDQTASLTETFMRPENSTIYESKDAGGEISMNGNFPGGEKVSGEENLVVGANPYTEEGGIKTEISISTEDILLIIWLLGAVIMTVYILISNVRLFSKLNKHRLAMGTLSHGIPLYAMDGHNCLVGIMFPAIYIDIDRLEDSKVIDNVIRHELQHYKMKDNLWQLLRVVCLILQWHNPFVWWAYFASRRDCELACDAGVVRDLSEEEKYEYGSSLLAVVEATLKEKRMISMTTAIGADKKFMMHRIQTIMQHRKKYAVCLSVVVFCAIGVVCFVTLKVSTQAVSKSDIQPETLTNASSEEYISEENQTVKEYQISEGNHSAVNLHIEDYYITNTGDPSNLYYIDENKVLWGCGRNNYGQLGQGTQDYDFHKDMVKIAENVIHVDYSQTGFTIFLTEDHKLYGMGNAGCGALQQYEEFSWSQYTNGEHYVVSTPYLLMEEVIYARCGRSDVACLTEDSSVWIWGTIGWNSQTVCFQAEPEKVLENAVLVTGGFFNHAALLQDGSVWTWGYNYAGSCGVEGESIVTTPTKVSEDIVMVWTGSTKYNVDCYDISEFEGIYERGLENTIIQKRDGSYWICGANVGTEEKILPIYYEVTNYALICTHEFLPYEEGEIQGNQSKKEIVAPPLDYNFSQADEQNIYYLFNNKIYKFNKATEEEQSIYESKGLVWCMEKYKDYLYFIEERNENAEYTLCRISTNGEHYEEIAQEVSNCLGITDNYLFVRSYSVENKISDTIFEVEDTEVRKLESGYTINYTGSSQSDIKTDADAKRLLFSNEILFEVTQEDYLKIIAYSDRYIFADIMDTDGRVKQLLFYDLDKKSSKVYPNTNDIHLEIRKEWVVCYLYGEAIEVRIINMKDI